MPREASLPPIFAAYQGQVQFVQRVSNNESCSSCPNCGGSVHPNGEWPDRCRWLLVGKANKPIGFCRKCGSIFWPDGTGSVSEEDMVQFRQEQIEREEARKRSAERALSHLRSEKIWQQWHSQMDDRARQHWRRVRGIPDAFQDWWQLGFVYNHRFFANAAAFHSDAETIPLFGPGWKPLNVKLRLQQFAEEHGKYRYLLAPRLVDEHPPFLCNPDLPLGDRLIVVEGEIKAMVTFATLDDAKASMIGIPSCRVNPQTIEMLKGREVTFVADPDAREQVWDLCKAVGLEKCRVVRTHMKIDDGIIAAGMTKRDVQHLLSTAIPAKAR